MQGYVHSIESTGLVDGPGIRTVVFLGGCTLRCKYCQNPDTWFFKEPNMSASEVASKIMRNLPYFKNNGGVTFSGGEPLLQSKFIIEIAKILKEKNIHIALDTAGVGLNDYDELLPYIDLVLLDIKHTNPTSYQELTGKDMNEALNFITYLNKHQKEVWIRQVIVPNLTDSEEYLNSLANFLLKINNITRVDFLPYHKLGDEKYTKLGLKNPYQNKKAMNQEECTNLYQKFLKIYHEKTHTKNNN